MKTWKKLSAVCWLLLLCASVPALQAEEPERWYLITEGELRSIERYRETSEAERRNWLLQVHELKTEADNLRAYSANLNSQLAQARERNVSLEQSFNELEAGWLKKLSLRNGEIADLKQNLADKALEAERQKGKAAARLVIAVALAAAWVVYLGFKVRLF